MYWTTPLRKKRSRFLYLGQTTVFDYFGEERRSAYVFRQPASAEEELACANAMDACPRAAIYSNGDVTWQTYSPKSSEPGWQLRVLIPDIICGYPYLWPEQNLVLVIAHRGDAQIPDFNKILLGGNSRYLTLRTLLATAPQSVLLNGIYAFISCDAIYAIELLENGYSTPNWKYVGTDLSPRSIGGKTAQSPLIQISDGLAIASFLITGANVATDQYPRDPVTVTATFGISIGGICPAQSTVDIRLGPMGQGPIVEYASKFKYGFR
jgi:hypothetical protein